jgi:hypothetical protein
MILIILLVLSLVAVAACWYSDRKEHNEICDILKIPRNHKKVYQNYHPVRKGWEKWRP